MNDQCAADEVMSLQKEEGNGTAKRKACGGNDINFIEVSDAGGKACLSVTTVKIRSKEGVAIELEVALGNGGSEGRIEANTKGHEVVVVDEQNDVLMEESSCEEVKSVAYKRLWECQTEAFSNIIALEEMLKQCREKDQQKKAVSEIDDVSRLPLSRESCEELRKLAQKIESQLSEIIGSYAEAVVP
ncbi:hypothetical protein DY000_02019441 [Brassica cretica]|uniref:Uncharacterized protein n=1 Tax=Brassica cretica TaxID=69181 RepID=A0ABQ7D370_BRACR|nr:hypothetical protein DY000_02019441 [Brassica cretica]